MDFPKLRPSSSSNPYIPPHRTQLHPRLHSLLSPSPPPIPNKHTPAFKWLIFFASLFTVPFLFYLFSTGQKIHTSSKFSQPKSRIFGLVIDAGSSGSRINVFEFLGEGRVPFLDKSGGDSLKIRPGLVDFSGDPDAAGGSIMQLIEFAKRRVPKKEWRNTKVQLMATSELEKLNMEVREEILESCRLVLRSSGFLFKDDWARVIQGDEEGISAWVAINYALGTLGREPHETIGIVELGGASLQVTRALIEAMPVQSSKIIRLAGVTYNLYSQSLPQFGQDVAWESMGELLTSRILTDSDNQSERTLVNPCIPRGYDLTFDASDGELQTPHPAGNFSACRTEALALLRRMQDRCLHPPCKTISSFYKLPGKQISSENFFYTSEFFGMVPRTSFFELEVAGRHYCEDDWHTLKNQHHDVDDMDLLKHCFTSAYTMALLHASLGIPMEEKREELGNHTGRIPLHWTLGSFIMRTMLEPVEVEAENIGQIVGNESVTHFSLFAFLLVIVLAAFFILQWQKPQVKTIYDLEKGRYIITRLPR